TPFCALWIAHTPLLHSFPTRRSSDLSGARLLRFVVRLYSCTVIRLYGCYSRADARKPALMRSASSSSEVTPCRSMGASIATLTSARMMAAFLIFFEPPERLICRCWSSSHSICCVRRKTVDWWVASALPASWRAGSVPCPARSLPVRRRSGLSVVKNGFLLPIDDLLDQRPHGCRFFG